MEICCSYRRPQGISTTSHHISFEFLFIKTSPPDNLDTRFRRGIELRNRIRYVICVRGASFDEKEFKRYIMIVVVSILAAIESIFRNVEITWPVVPPHQDRD
jgi:hypothetical protein